MVRVGWALAALSAAALGCGGGGSERAPLVTQSVPEDTGGVPPLVTTGGGGHEGCGGEVTVRLRGVGAGALGTFQLSLGPVEARAAVPLTLADALPPGPIDLVLDHAYRLGIVTPPAGASSVHVTVPLVAASAALAPVDVCTAPIEFTFDPSRVDPDRCHVVVELDLGRSIQADAPGGVALLPQFTVRY